MVYPSGDDQFVCPGVLAGVNHIDIALCSRTYFIVVGVSLVLVAALLHFFKFILRLCRMPTPVFVGSRDLHMSAAPWHASLYILIYLCLLRSR